MNKVKTTLSFALNGAVVAAMVCVGVNQVGQARAAENLSTVSEADKFCLQQNIYFEARNQTTAGKVAVAWVTMNRVDSARYPDSICGVVKQGRKDSKGNMIRHKCQFSWYCDGKSDKISNNIVEQRAWEDAGLVAEVVLIDWARGKSSPVEEATMYHADYVNPYWSTAYEVVAKVDSHIFYQ